MAQDTKDPNALLRFLVAADVTAFAAAASGGEHQMRVRRALLFAPLGIEQTPCFCWVSQRSQEVIQVKSSTFGLHWEDSAVKNGAKRTLVKRPVHLGRGWLCNMWNRR